MGQIATLELQVQIQIHDMKFKLNEGFTLVELLIVIAIIGILSTLLTANFIGVRQRSRDSQRKSNLRQIQSALELYRADQGSYPTILKNCGNSLKSPDCTSSTYINNIPIDPNGTNYVYCSTGTTYNLMACLENGNDSERATPPNANPCSINPALCDGATSFSYTLSNP